MGGFSPGIRIDSSEMEATATGIDPSDYSVDLTGNLSQAIYEYHDIDINELQSGQTFTVKGNFDNLQGGDGWAGNSAEYELTSSLGFGSFTLDDDFENNGGWEFTFTADEILANSNWTQTGEFVFEFNISGFGSNASTQPFRQEDLIRISIACFASGTLIATPDGERTVEDLQIGDLIAAADGRIVPVKWVGRQTLVKKFMGERAQLVRIKAGTLDNHSDLYLTGDHGMLMEGYIINASALVNGSTIQWVPLAQTPDRHIVYHIETDEHDLILANGAAAETFLDNPARKSFDNFADYRERYGDEQTVQEMGLPRISAARLVPRLLLQGTLGMADSA